jgi:LacI family transcriptional regulator
MPATRAITPPPPPRRRAAGAATIADVARAAAVSIATVSRVINDAPHRVGEATRRRVLRAVRALDFRPNVLARSLHRLRTRTIGLILPDISNPYYAEITRGIEAVARRHGYALFICNTEREPAAMAHHIRLCREHQVDGVIVAGGGTWGRAHLAGLAARGTAAVLIGRHDVRLPAVRVDNVKGAYLAAQHLIRAGHRRIAVIAGPAASTTGADRLAGYRLAAREHGLAIPRRWVRAGDLRPTSGAEAAAALLRLRPRPTAILAANDQMAIGAMRAARAVGLAVPGDLSVVGFDDIELASCVTPPLTTMALPLARMGAAAMEIMLRCLADPHHAEEIWFTPELAARESSGPAAEKETRR